MLWCRRHQSICRRQFDIDYNKYSAASTMEVPPACRRPRSTSHMASSNGKSSQQTASSTGWQHWIRIWNLYRQRIIHDLDCLLQLLTMRETVYWNVHWLLLCRDIGAKKTVGFVIGVFLKIILECPPGGQCLGRVLGRQSQCWARNTHSDLPYLNTRFQDWGEY